MEPRYRGDPIGDEDFEVPAWDGEDAPEPELDLRTGEEEKELPPSLDATWSVLADEPDMDDIVSKAVPEFFDRMTGHLQGDDRAGPYPGQFNIYPFQARTE